MEEWVEEDALLTCALRFKGYDYEEAQGIKEPDCVGGGLGALADPVVESLTLHKNPLDNMAAFFALQRHLHVWAGFRERSDSKTHTAYCFLFLDVYRMKVPRAFQHKDYCKTWKERYEPRREEIAARVRAALANTRELTLEDYEGGLNGGGGFARAESAESGSNDPSRGRGFDEPRPTNSDSDDEQDNGNVRGPSETEPGSWKKTEPPEFHL